METRELAIPEVQNRNRQGVGTDSAVLSVSEAQVLGTQNLVLSATVCRCDSQGG